MAGFLPGESSPSRGSTRPVRRAGKQKPTPTAPTGKITIRGQGNTGPLPPTSPPPGGGPVVPAPGPGLPIPPGGPKRLPVKGAPGNSATKPKQKFIRERDASGKKVKGGKWVRDWNGAKKGAGKAPSLGADPGDRGRPRNPGPLKPGGKPSSRGRGNTGPMKPGKGDAIPLAPARPKGRRLPVELVKRNGPRTAKGRRPRPSGTY